MALTWRVHTLPVEALQYVSMHRRTVLARTALAFSASALSTPSIWAQASNSFQDEAWTDARRGRVVPVRIRWPVASPSTPPGDAPMVLFSHGLGGTREGGCAWGSAWAGAGFAVVHVQHPGSDLDAVRVPGGLRSAMSGAQLLARLDDMVFVLDEIGRRHTAAQATRWRTVRPDAAGMSGHSFGAHTTLGVAGQAYPGYPPLVEKRLAAFAAFSPALPAGGNAQRAFAAITRPMLCLTGTLDSDVVSNGSTPENRRTVFDALPTGHKAQLVLKDADHMTFGGQNEGGHSRLAAILRRQQVSQQAQPGHHALVAALTTDWWRAHLLNDAQARSRLTLPAGLGPQDEWRTG